MAIDHTTYAAGADRSPAFIVLPGGGYTHHADHEGEPVARWLNGLGIHAVVVRYQVGPGCYPGALHDAREALIELREGGMGMAVDPDRVGVIGFSAGGHVAALLATDTDDLTGTERWTYADRPDAAILAYPLTDLRSSLSGRVPNLREGDAERFLGDAASAELISELSIATRITAPDEGDPTPPIFVWTTSDDDTVPALHSLELMTSLAVAGVPYEGHIFRTGEHGLGLGSGQSVGQWTTLAERWLTDLGWVRTA